MSRVDEREVSQLEILYDSWLEDDAAMADNEPEAEIKRIGRELDGMAAGIEHSTELLADYEEAARHAGFIGGFKAALAILQEIGA